ncbi:uncharacterized protein LOC112688364 [Sipha flava]|uniref:Uncharacterized protein LOC112688364 n=1 Tax=Sipha flava TaxID=143950 RepID=A0A8B8G3R6_9HEMI|nr:uncharacterized protein LOC112688364 [Sipha flava]
MEYLEKEVDGEFYDAGIQKLPDRLQKCLDMNGAKPAYPSSHMTPEQLQNLLPYKKSEDSIHFSLPNNFVPGSIAFANFPVRPNMRKYTIKPYSRKVSLPSNWFQSEAKRIYVKKTMNLYHWTQPELPTETVRKLVSNSWDNMPEEEKQVYEKQANGENGPLMVHPHLSLMYQYGQLGKLIKQ